MSGQSPSIEALPLLTVAEAARLLGAKTYPVYKLCKKGKLAHGEIGERIVIPRSEVERYAQELVYG